MKRIIALVGMVAMAACGGMPGTNSNTSWKPEECFNNAFMGDVNDLKEGRVLVYCSEAGGAKSTTTWKVCCKCGDNWCVENWMESGDMKYGFLLSVAPDGKVVKAYAAGKDDKKWTEIKVKDAPTGTGTTDGPKPEITMSDEEKEVKAGKFACKKTHVKMVVSGNTYESDMWNSKDVWCLQGKSEHGGLVAMDSAGSKMWLESKAEDGKATLEMPK